MPFSSPAYALQDTPESFTMICSPSYLMRSTNYEAPRAYNFLNIPWHPLTQIRIFPSIPSVVGSGSDAYLVLRPLWVTVELGILYTWECHKLANDLSLTEKRSITDADGLELADRPVELLSANSAKEINENHAVPQKSRRQTRREHIIRAKIASLHETKATTSLRTCLKWITQSTQSTQHTARPNLYLHYLL
jgi:hypothetical protein